MSVNEHTHDTQERLLRPGSEWPAYLFSRPLILLWGGVVLMVALGWSYLLLMTLGALSRSSAAESGIGMGVMDLFADWKSFSAFGGSVLDTICRPVQSLSEGGTWSALDLVLVFAMWIAMTLAMMVPTAAPMISAYADIALTAREKDIKVVPTAVLLSGYLIAWFAFCVLATLGQWLLALSASLTPALTLANPYIAAAILVGAGLYQFTALKQMCLTKCRTPLPFFMSNWTDRTSGVFVLGLRQGLFCVTCCWSLMMVMFAVGLMNIVWMAGLAIIMALEKTLVNPRLVVQGTGLGLIGAGVALLATSFG